MTQQYFPTVWKEVAIVSVFRGGNHAAVGKYRPISILDNLSKLFEFIIHDHVLNTASPNPNLVVSNNLVTFSPTARSQRQADAVYFSLDNVFDLVPHNLLLNE
jgi:hypothetical protein